MHSWPDIIIRKLVLWLCCLLAHLNPVWDHLTFENMYGPFPMQTPYIGSPLPRKLLKAGKFKLQVVLQWTWMMAQTWSHSCEFITKCLLLLSLYSYHPWKWHHPPHIFHAVTSVLSVRFFFTWVHPKLGNNHLWVPYTITISVTSQPMRQKCSQARVWE